MTDTEFREAFRAHKDVIYRYAYRMTGTAPSAEDVVQDVFVALWRKPQAFQPDRGTVRSFLLGIARNYILKRWRDERSHESLDDVIVPVAAGDDLLDRAGSVARAMASLPSLQREAIILAEFEGMALEEAAQA